ncbi:MAG: 1,4-dihydroxy-2-naphthoate octaprenyltransferase [bacterium ADurb.Bin431]|nr:MAG: 1,4-dihydroxy-2-naphthoate octaprenyltransferase [bacterium ADurb.Bin431]
MAWVALVPLLVALRRKGIREAMMLGFTAGLVFHVGILYWITYVVVKYGSLSLTLGVAAMLLLFFTRHTLWPWLAGLYLLAAFFSKYYTAAPVKLAYRGLGELAVWFAFGPMAILVAAVSQNTLFHPFIIAAMPITGLSTSSILWMGQLIDLQADSSSGKRGLVARTGSRLGRWGFLVIHLLLIANLIVLALIVLPQGWPLLAALLPYLLLPRTWKQVLRYHDQPGELKAAAGWNVQIHLGMAVLLVLGLCAVLLLH